MNFNTFQNKKVLNNAKSAGWRLYPLTDLLIDDSRNSLKIKKRDYIEVGDTPIIDQGKELIGGYSDVEDGFYKEKSYIVFGDHTRILKYIDFPAFIGADGVKILKNINEEVAITKYLYYFLSTISIPDTGYNRHFKFLKEVIIPVPKIDVQIEIVNLLDKTMNVIDKRQQQIEALSALKQSVFLDMFGDPNSSDNKYPKERIGNLIEVQTGKTPSRKNLNYWNNGDVPWIKTTEVKNKRIESSSEFVTEEAVNESKLKLFPINTIFIAMYGQGKTRGQSALLTFPATCNQACAALLPNESMDELFLWNQLLLQYESLRSLGRGGNQPNLNLSLVRDFEILTPPLSLQQEYSNSIKRVDKIIEEIKNSYLYLEQLYDSLIHKSFNGELFKEDIKV